MSTAQLSIELVLAGVLALCAFILPLLKGTDISADVLQSNAFIGVLGVAYLLGVVFDKLADTMLKPMEDSLRLRQANRLLQKKSKNKLKDPFPQDKLEYRLRKANDGRLQWMEALKSRIRTSRELAVLGLPATMGVAIYLGSSKDCAMDGTQGCPPDWIYFFVGLNLLLLIAAAWKEWRTPAEDDVKREGQMEQASRQTRIASLPYYLLIVSSSVAILIVATLKPGISAIAFLGAGGFIVSLLSLWACLRITRTYMKFVAQEMSGLLAEKSE